MPGNIRDAVNHSAVLKAAREWVETWLTDNPIPDGAALVRDMRLSRSKTGDLVEFGQSQALARQLEFGSATAGIPELLFLTKLRRHLVSVMEADIKRALKPLMKR